MKKPVAVVTGSTSGIGRAIAEKLGSSGVQVIITGRNREAGISVARAIAQKGGEAAFIEADILNDKELSSLFEQTISQFGSLDACICCAGDAQPVPRFSVPRSRSILELNVREYADRLSQTLLLKLLPARAAVDHMIQQHKGMIMFVTRESTTEPSLLPKDALGKEGILLRYVTEMAEELKARNIRVNAISIAPVSEIELLDDSPKNPQDRLLSHIDLKQSVVEFHSEIAKLISFLVSDEGKSITGRIVGHSTIATIV